MASRIPKPRGELARGQRVPNLTVHSRSRMTGALPADQGFRCSPGALCVSAQATPRGIGSDAEYTDVR
jgi:hypothetical protein